MEYAPFGTFNQLVNTGKFSANHKLVRTFFRQLVAGVDHLHSKGIAHLDLKPENLLIGEEYLLKIIDFDRAYSTADAKPASRGTEDFRAPEVKAGKINDPFLADIYSMGIILFFWLSAVQPYSEELDQENPERYDLFKYLMREDPKFWKAHGDLNGLKFESDFIELFTLMTKPNPIDRISIISIKSSAWYLGEICSDQELANLMSKRV
jgi:serine/threonine protein kinase